METLAERRRDQAQLRWAGTVARWLLGAALLLAACQTGDAGTGGSATSASGAPRAAPAAIDQPASAPADRQAEQEQTPPAQYTEGLPTGLPTGGPRPPEVLEEYVGPLWGSFGERHFYSAALEREMPYFLYLPPGYEQSSREYPVLYMLHGASGDNAEWATIKLIDWADRLIMGREIPPLIVILPQGDFGYWVNHVAGGPRWGDYVTEDLVGHLDETYRTLRRPEARAVGGLSQGGHAAFQLTFNHPEVFRVAGAHSPSLREDDGFLPWLGTGAEFARRDPISLAQTLPLATLQRATLWLDVGSDDQWRPRVEVLHQILAERGVAHEWHVWPGGHDGEYWQPNVPVYLRYYYGRALRNGVDTP